MSINCPQIAIISLDSNSISSTSGLHPLLMLPNIIALSLKDNHIRNHVQLEPLIKAVPKMRDLVLEGNFIREETSGAKQRAVYIE